MSINVNREDNIRVYKTETGWLFFNLKGSEKMSDGKYKDVFTKITLKLVGDCKGLELKNKALIHLDNAKLSFDITKDKDGNRVYRYSLLVFNCSVLEEGIDEFYEFKKFSKENNQKTTTEDNNYETMVGADDILPF